jgi:hypothetical protein
MGAMTPDQAIKSFNRSPDEIDTAKETFKNILDEVKKEKGVVDEVVVALSPIVFRVTDRGFENRLSQDEEFQRQLEDEAQKTRFWTDGDMTETFRRACVGAVELGHGSEFLAREILSHLHGGDTFPEKDIKPLQIEIETFLEENSD